MLWKELLISDSVKEIKNDQKDHQNELSLNSTAESLPLLTSQGFPQCFYRHSDLTNCESFLPPDIFILLNTSQIFKHFLQHGFFTYKLSLIFPKTMQTIWQKTILKGNFLIWRFIAHEIILYWCVSVSTQWWYISRGS